MNMRWAWTLPLVSIWAVTLAMEPARAQNGTGAMGTTGAPPGGPGYPQAPMAGIPVAMMPSGMPAAMPAGYGPMPAGYAPQAAMMQGGYPAAMGYMPAGHGSPYGMMPAAYMGGPVAGEPTPAPQAPGQFPGAAAPDVYGAYGYVPTNAGPPGYGPPGYGPPDYAQGGGAPGAPMYDPSNGMPGGGDMYGGGYGGPGGDACQYCGGNGCEACQGGLFGLRHGYAGGHGSWLPNGLLGDVLGLVAPYPDGGCAAVRWFDFSVDYMMLKRDSTGRSHQVFATQGINGLPALTADQLDFGSYKPGFRFTGAFQVGPANSVEFTYFGQFNYNSHSRAHFAGNLYGVYSQFGTSPFAGAGGFQEWDQADFQRIDYTSNFDSFEVNWRKRWMAPNCRYQGSWTLGVRHFILDETFSYASSSTANGFLPAQPGTNFTPARGLTNTDTTNNLTGIQFGTDMWVCLLPGLRAGGEVQAGVYGNHMNINTTIGSNVPGTTVDFRENLVNNDVAFLGQINLLATYRINYQWTIRGSYQFLYLDGVALAPENFNTILPAINDPLFPRQTVKNDNGNVFYHGWNVGLEFMW